jgi:hypothetical protein
MGGCLVTEKFTLGLDLGQQFDFTAICIAQIERDAEGPLARVRHLERFNGKDFTWVAEHVKGIMYRPPLSPQNTALLVDTLNVGNVVSSLLRKSGVNHRRIEVHGGG